MIELERISHMAEVTYFVSPLPLVATDDGVAAYTNLRSKLRQV
jgi:hypothetical protein